MPVMGWEIHPAKDSFKAHVADWDRLNAKLYNSHPFFDSRFVGSLLEYFATGKEKLCIHKEKGVTTDALILQPMSMGRWSSFQPSQAQATAILVTDANRIKTLFPALPSLVWTIELLAVDPRYSPDCRALPLPLIAHPHARTIGVDSSSSFSDYWNQRAKNLRANVRRYFNRTERESTQPLMSMLSEPTEMRSGVERFGMLETAGWKGASGTAVSISNVQGEFYSDVLGRFALTNQAAVYELHIDEKLAASRLVIKNDNLFIILKTTYDETLSRFAPGRILLYRVIEEQLESKSGRTIEFYTNATRDQAEWATFDCTIQNIQIFRNNSSATLFALLKVVQKKLKELIGRGAIENEASAADDVNSFSRIEEFTEAQYDLSEYAAKRNIELSIDWFDLLQRTVYPQDKGVRYYFMAEEYRPSQILPLRLVKKGRIRIIESLSNYYTSLYAPLLTDNGDVRQLRHLLAAADTDHDDAHVMYFSPMDPGSTIYKNLLSEIWATGWIPFRFFCFGNWFLEVKDSWEGYLNRRSGNLRSTFKRRNKAFSTAGGTLEIVTTPEAVESAIVAFQEVYSASWKIPEPYPDFVPSLIRLLSAKGMLRLGIARLHEKPIAAQLWIVHQGKASIYKVAYHEGYASYSPGTILTGFLMHYVIEQDRVKEVDFLIGDDPYKSIWMSHRRERWGIVAYNPRTFIGNLLLAKEVLTRATKSIRKKLSATTIVMQRPGLPTTANPLSQKPKGRTQ